MPAVSDGTRGMNSLVTKSYVTLLPYGEDQMPIKSRFNYPVSLTFLLLCICATAAGSDGPEAVMLRFCELDGAAARMSSALPESPKLRNLTAGEGESPTDP